MLVLDYTSVLYNTELISLSDRLYKINIEAFPAYSLELIKYHNAVNKQTVRVQKLHESLRKSLLRKLTNQMMNILLYTVF